MIFSNKGSPRWLRALDVLVLTGLTISIISIAFLLAIKATTYLPNATSYEVVYKLDHSGYFNYAAIYGGQLPESYDGDIGEYELILLENCCSEFNGESGRRILRQRSTIWETKSEFWQDLESYMVTNTRGFNMILVDSERWEYRLSSVVPASFAMTMSRISDHSMTIQLGHNGEPYVVPDIVLWNFVARREDPNKL